MVRLHLSTLSNIFITNYSQIYWNSWLKSFYLNPLLGRSIIDFSISCITRSTRKFTNHGKNLLRFTVQGIISLETLCAKLTTFIEYVAILYSVKRRGTWFKYSKSLKMPSNMISSLAAQNYWIVNYIQLYALYKVAVLWKCMSVI